MSEPSLNHRLSSDIPESKFLNECLDVIESPKLLFRGKLLSETPAYEIYNCPDFRDAFRVAKSLIQEGSGKWSANEKKAISLLEDFLKRVEELIKEYRTVILNFNGFDCVRKNGAVTGTRFPGEGGLPYYGSLPEGLYTDDDLKSLVRKCLEESPDFQGNISTLEIPSLSDPVEIIHE
ncbi:MAG: hypothetical protein OEL89_01915 [Candidatus Peregrinibacteria bacterium]|nr:hypothetical protein [Candidatus Peregrinibacteria bacterium]